MLSVSTGGNWKLCFNVETQIVVGSIMTESFDGPYSWSKVIVNVNNDCQIN